jgi:arsenate reductase
LVKKNKKKVIFICSYNSVRSQMAEGLLKNIYPDRYEVYSAGIQSTGVNPHAIIVIKEIGIDISNQQSNSLDEFIVEEFDCVVTVCSDAEKNCPFLPANVKHIHKGFIDPARTKGSEEDIIKSFREVRDQMKEWIESTFK